MDMHLARLMSHMAAGHTHSASSRDSPSPSWFPFPPAKASQNTTTSGSCREHARAQDLSAFSHHLAASERGGGVGSGESTLLTLRLTLVPGWAAKKASARALTRSRLPTRRGRQQMAKEAGGEEAEAGAPRSARMAPSAAAAPSGRHTRWR